MKCCVVRVHRQEPGLRGLVTSLSVSGDGEESESAAPLVPGAQVRRPGQLLEREDPSLGPGLFRLLPDAGGIPEGGKGPLQLTALAGILCLMSVFPVDHRLPGPNLAFTRPRQVTLEEDQPATRNATRFLALRIAQGSQWSLT